MAQHICIIYDCLFPWTIGGAERWYRNMAKEFAARGYTVTFLTLCQWNAGDAPAIDGVEVIAVGPRLALYGESGRRIWPPVRFGIGVFLHLLRNGRRYDRLHLASFPYFSLLATAILRPLFRYELAVDWHEVWSRDYWKSYLGRVGGEIGWRVQNICARVPQKAFSFSRLHAGRLKALAPSRSVTLLPGEFDGEAPARAAAATPATVVYAGRLIPEKQVHLLVDALAFLMQNDQHLRAQIFGAGPEYVALQAQSTRLGLSDRIEMPGFVSGEIIERAMAEAAVIVQPSAREGYGMVIVESSARGVPIVVVAGPDNAATELVDAGENGFIASNPGASSLAAAISSAIQGGELLRIRTREWFIRNERRLSFRNSVDIVITEFAK